MTSSKVPSAGETVVLTKETAEGIAGLLAVHYPKEPALIALRCILITGGKDK